MVVILSCLTGVCGLPAWGQRPASYGLSFATVLGSSGTENCEAIDVDPSGAIYLGCHSNSPTLPTGGSPAYWLHGDMDGFVIKLSPNGSEVQYVTHLGGSSWDGVRDIAVDTAGFVFVAGNTRSPNLWTGGRQVGMRRDSLGTTAFIARLSPDGDVLWLSYLGGSGTRATAIALDQDANAYVTGSTTSPDFPTTAHAVQRRRRFGRSVAYVTKFDSAGRIVYSTLLGGANDDAATGLAVDRDGNAYVSGVTASFDFPLVKPLQRKKRGGDDCFVSIIDAGGSRVLFSTYWGGSESDRCSSVALDLNGRFYLTGSASRQFPVTRGALQVSSLGNGDVFVTAFEPRGRGIAYSTLIGGRERDEPSGISIDDQGRAFVTGNTASPDYPTVQPFQGSLQGVDDGFISIVTADGAALLYSTYFGGHGGDVLEDVVVDADGGVSVTGMTTYPDFPAVASTRRWSAGVRDIVIAQLSRIASRGS